MTDEKPRRAVLDDIARKLGKLESMDETMRRLCRNQTLAICVFTLIMLVVLIQGQKIEIKIPGILEIRSAAADGSK